MASTDVQFVHNVSSLPNSQWPENHNSFIDPQIDMTSISSTPSEPRVDVVRLPRAQYDHLVQVAAQYANLSQNLISGGVDDATIQLLSGHVANAQAQQTNSVIGNGYGQSKRVCQDSKMSADQEGSRYPLVDGYVQQPELPNMSSYRTVEWAASVSSTQHRHIAEGVTANHVGATISSVDEPEPRRPRFERNATRSIQLVNLADGTTHADITAVVRGGLLLDIYLRGRDKTASISFLHGTDAAAFFHHVRKNDLYIKNKRVDIKWNERQYVLSSHMAHKIEAGATRNLVIRHHDPNNSLASIREDLEHIHNLKVIKLEVIAGSCFISTNSASNAMFARTCMMSRLKYKCCRIEWDLDECAQSLDRMPVYKRAPPVPPVTKQPINPMANRFKLLAVD